MNEIMNFQFIVYLFSYFVLLLGLYMIISKNKISVSYRNSTKLRARVWERLKIFKYFTKVSRVIDYERKWLDVKAMVVIAMLLCFITTLLLRDIFTTKLLFLIDLLLMVCPFLLTEYRLKNFRNKASKEGYVLISEIYNNYQLNHKNMSETIETVSYQLDKDLITKKLMMILTLGIRQYRSTTELKGYLEDFKFGVQAEWAYLLAGNIYLALEMHYDVSDALADLLIELETSIKLQEKAKRLNFESVLILKMLTPTLYVVTVFIAIKYFDFTIYKFIQYQIFNPVGLKYFIIMILTIFLNFILVGFVQDEKLDL